MGCRNPLCGGGVNGSLSRPEPAGGKSGRGSGSWVDSGTPGSRERASGRRHRSASGERGGGRGARLVLLAVLLVVLLEGGEVLAGLGELALLHALADVPVDE